MKRFEIEIGRCIDEEGNILASPSQEEISHLKVEQVLHISDNSSC